MNRWVWLLIMLFAFLMGSFHAYNLGYSHAEARYEREMWHLREKHSDQLQEMLKKRLQD